MIYGLLCLASVTQHSVFKTCLCCSMWLVAQTPLSMGFPRQKYWSGLPFPPPEDLPNPGIKPPPLVSPASAGRFFTTLSPGKPIVACLSTSFFYGRKKRACHVCF